jgi:hypothetical protein
MPMEADISRELSRLPSHLAITKFRSHVRATPDLTLSESFDGAVERTNTTVLTLSV